MITLTSNEMRFCMADIHGFIAEFEEALSMVMEHLKEDDTMLFLLGDYIHGGGYDYEVLVKIMGLQASFGTDNLLKYPLHLVPAPSLTASETLLVREYAL